MAQKFTFLIILMTLAGFSTGFSQSPTLELVDMNGNYVADRGNSNHSFVISSQNGIAVLSHCQNGDCKEYHVVIDPSSGRIVPDCKKTDGKDCHFDDWFEVVPSQSQDDYILDVYWSDGLETRFQRD